MSEPAPSAPAAAGATYSAVEVIRRKRDGQPLDADAIAWLVQAYTSGEVADYQMAAFLMAVLWRGMTSGETVALTLAMLHSGTELRMRDTLALVADKHSTGGVGDKVTLAVAPLVAACGLPVAKMSGRGLGHTGGTVDKLESVTGLQTVLEPDAFRALVARTGLALAAQSSTLAPADGMMYALRDVTATVDCMPLIASSIMSKKLAVGPSHLLLDVKVGTGAFMKTVHDARQLAETMVRIGVDAGVHTVAVMSAMDQPLGRAVGNALELAEAVAILRGEGPADVLELTLHETATLLVMAGLAANDAVGHARAEAAIASGAGLAKLIEVVAAQGGDPRQIEDTSLLPRAPWREMVVAPRAGWLSRIDAEAIGAASVRLGAGRARKGDPIDHAVGLVLQAKVGEGLDAGAPLIEVHARSEADGHAVRDALLAAYAWSDSAPPASAMILGTVTAG